MRQQKGLSFEELGREHVIAFYEALKEQLRDQGSNFGKEYLKSLVDYIRVENKEVRLTVINASKSGALCSSFCK
jgi:hypothetical protein